MATFTYNQILNAVQRAERAAETYINVASSQQDFTRAEFEDIKTLKRRIDDYLNLKFVDFIGDDGVDVVSIAMDAATKNITVSFSDGTSETFTDLYVPSIINYIISSNELIQVKEDGSIRNLGRVVGDSADQMTSAAVQDNGSIVFTTNQGNSYVIGNVDNFGENPITAVRQENGELFLQLGGVWMPDAVGRVAGDAGTAGSIPVEKLSSTPIISWNGEFVTLTIERTIGSPIVLTDVPFDLRTAAPEDALKLDVDVDDSIIFTLPTGARLNIGNVNGIDGDDGNNRVPDFNEGRLSRVRTTSGTPPATTYNWVEDSEYQRLVFKSENWNYGTGYPTLRIISPYTVDKATAAPTPTSTFVEPVIPLRGIYRDIIADDVTISDAGIDSNRNAFIDVSFTDIDDNQVVERIIIGEAKGEDGLTLESITVTPNGDIEVQYDGVVAVIGNIQYDVLTDASIDPISGKIVFEFTSGNTLETTSNDINGEDGIARSVNEIIIDLANEGMLSLIMNKGDDILDIGKLRPLQDHEIDVTPSGDLQIRFSGAEEPETLGNIRGIDASRDITDVLFDGEMFELEVNGDAIEQVQGVIEKFDNLEFIESDNIIRFSRTDRDFDVEYTRLNDGEHLTNITSWDVVTTSDNRELTITLSDGSTPVDGVEIDGKWIESIVIDSDEKVIVEYGNVNGTVFEELPNSATGYNAEDGTFPQTIQIEGLDLWVRDWNDGKPDENLGQVVAKWIEDLYLDSNGEVFYQYNTDSTPTATGLFLDGDDARYITSLTINSERQLAATYNIGEDDILDNIDGFDARYITEISRDGDDFEIQFSNGDIEIVTLESFDGILPRWITEFEISNDREFQVKFAGTDYDLEESEDQDFTTIGPADGVDARWITEISRDGDEFTVVWNDASTEVLGNIDGFDGINGEFISSMTISPQRELIIQWHANDKPDETISTNIDFDREVDSVAIDDMGRVITTYSNGVTSTTAIALLRRVLDAYVDEESEIGYIETTYGEIEVGYTAGEDFVDGVTIVDIRRNANTLEVELSDGLVVSAGAFLRREMINAVLSDNELVLQFTDSTTQNLGNVRGESSSLNIVSAFINQNGELVLTLDDPNDPTPVAPIAIGGVRGVDGNGIASIDVVDGELIFTLDDDSEINLGVISIDFGFAPYNPETVYQETQSMTYNGRIYVAQRNGVTTTPDEDAGDWVSVRLVGDPTPDAGRPEPIAPDVMATATRRPYLEGGSFRNYFSPDILKYREFEIDLMSGDFSSPLYSAQENALSHQSEIELSEGVEYKWRIRDIVDIDSGREYTTTWSRSATFMVEESTISRPSIFVAEGLNPNQMISRAGFDSTGYFGTNPHATSRWQIIRNSDGVIIFDEESTEDLEGIVLAWTTLRANTSYRVRVRYKDSLGNLSEWSEWLQIQTQTRFDAIEIKPSIEIIGDANNAVAKPSFTSSSNIGEFWDSYLGKQGLSATWGVYNSNDEMIWSIVSAIDITSVQVTEILTSEESYRVRVRYESNEFVGPSEWSDFFEFTPVWSISTPVISYSGDINEVPFGENSFEISFAIENDSFRFIQWELQTPEGTVLGSGLSDDPTEISVDISVSDQEVIVRVSVIAENANSEFGELSIFMEALGPGPSQLIAGDMTAGFFGEVPVSELITGDDLAAAIGLTAGTSQFSNEPWLKFALDDNIIYVAKKPYRHSISWQHIYQAGAVYGTGDNGLYPSGGNRLQDANITVDGFSLDVTLLRGANTDPANLSQLDNSEWNRMLISVHEQSNRLWNYTNTELAITTPSNSRAQWCIETTGSNKIYRGQDGINSGDSRPPTNTTNHSWRPVLRLIKD